MCIRDSYFSTSVKEFWNRWHISLSSWLRDYVYSPLGGSRCSTARCCVNLLITFLVSGLWHGTGPVSYTHLDVYKRQMDEMIDFCIRFEQQQNPGLDAEDARRAMRAWYPTLKRWKQAQG